MITLNGMHLPVGPKITKNHITLISTLPDDEYTYEMDIFMYFQQLNFVNHFLDVLGQQVRFLQTLSVLGANNVSKGALSIAKKIRLSDFQSQILQTSGISRGLILQFLSRAEYILAREITIRVLY